MAKAEQTMFERSPAIMLFVVYVIVTLVSAAVIYLANMFFPDAVVLGTVNIPVMWAIGLSASKLGLVTTFASGFFNEWELRRGKNLSPVEMILAYFVVNFVTLWAISRFAEIYGMGLSSWMVVIILALVVDVVQGAAVMMFQNMALKK